MSDLTTDDQRGAYILKEFSKKDPDKFKKTHRESIYLTMMKLFERDVIKEIPDKIENLSTPAHILDIRVGHFIEIANARPDSKSLENAEIVAGCLYREDWSKDFSKEEIIDTALKFREYPLRYSLIAMVKMSELFLTLQDRYPLLYDQNIDKEAKIEKTEEEGRKLYDMLQGLTNNKFVDWDEAKNRTLADAFVYLEEVKKEAIKQKLNEKK